jgi:hypothetical protein
MKVSYCTQICNRLWQLAITLPSNLENLKPDEQIVLVDYGSKDDMAQYVYEHSLCRKNIESGNLKFISVKNTTHYICPRAKNIAHRMADGEILVNLDGDNHLRNMRSAIDETFIDPNYKPVLHMTSRNHDGSFGRICFHKETFYELGGYDEGFMPSGYQDSDIINRAMAKGVPYKYVNINNGIPVKNSYQEKSSNTNCSDWKIMHWTNMVASLENIKRGRLVANSMHGWGEAIITINFDKNEQQLEAIKPNNNNS